MQLIQSTKLLRKKWKKGLNYYDREHNSTVSLLQLKDKGVEYEPFPVLRTSFDLEAFEAACADAGEHLRVVSWFMLAISMELKSRLLRRRKLLMTMVQSSM